MNGHRDIERTLDAWFVDGPTMMPDRLFDAVFDQVQRVPQRRLAHLQLRFTEMNPRIRIFTVLAAALLVVVAAIAVIGGGSSLPVRATPSPAPTASFDPTIPAALDGRWIGGTKAVQGIQPLAGSTIVFGNGTLRLTQSNDGSGTLMASKVTAVAGARIRLESNGNGQGCSRGDAGTYDWSVTPSGRTLTLTAASTDACAERQAALAAVWQDVGCDDPNDFCLGQIDAGTYQSQYFDPFVGPTETWRPRYGVLSYTVPDGWTNQADWPGEFLIAPYLAPGESAIYIHADVVVVSEEDPCQEIKAPGVGESAEAIATWLSSAPGVITSGSEQVKIGGLDAWRLDLSMDPAWTRTCPFSDGKPTRMLFTDRPSASGFHWGISGSTRMRAYLVDLGDGRAMLIDIETDQQDPYFSQFLAQSTAIVESMQLTP